MTDTVIVFILLVGLLSMLYTGPSYYRRLNIFIMTLQKDYPAKFEKLGRPTLSVTRITMRSAYLTSTYILFRAYLELQDEALTKLGDSTRWRLIINMTVFLVIMIVLPTAAKFLR